MKFTRLAILTISAVLLGTFGFHSYPVLAEQQGEVEYTIEDVRLLQDFLLAKPTKISLAGKQYDLNDDGRWDVFDLCLMKRRILQNQSKHEISVSTTDELKAALLNAAAGDTILLQPGTYENSQSGISGSRFYSNVEGTKTAPITIKSADPDNPAVLDGANYEKGIVLYITGGYWNISDIVLCNAQKGIILDHSDYSVISNVEVYNTGQEGIHLRDGSSHCQIIEAKVHDTGLAGSYGEGIYIGSAKSTTSYVHECDDNLVKGCILGPNISDESIDIKEYTTGNIIEECTMYGAGMTATDSFVDIKGNETIVRNNTCYSQDNAVITDAFQVHCQVEGWGIDNLVYGNTVYFSGSTEYIVRTWNGTSCTVYGNIRKPENSDAMYRAYSGSTLIIND